MKMKTEFFSGGDCRCAFAPGFSDSSFEEDF